MPELEGNTPAEPEPWEYVLHIPHDLRAVTVCRRTVRLVLTMHGLIRLTDIAELLATELVSNAVRHTKGPIALRLRMRAGVLRVGAWDADPEPPKPPLSAEALAQLTHSEEGRGLALVSSCADLWGWQPLSRDGRRGKYVWGDLVAA
ncbi:ATP-binding protein [Streptomyces sp. SID12488]|uniref:ATP-binding protein n=1 Tax=Streptomyces sp. SID12488 TaxID=2706040 RepID=UPI0013D8E78F|nr:ATP-binding protein [Streptomyces sp. SID12488]NEA68971.1 ATP-binding protein [Streptomyces sp. SID12488]